MGTSCGSGMHLSDHDLLQLDEAYLEGLSPEQARVLLTKALADLKAAREPGAESLEQFATAELARALGNGRGRA